MDAVFIPLSDAIGAPVDQIKLIACLLVCYPLGSIFIRLKYQTLKHVFNTAVSFFFLAIVLNMWAGFLQLLGSILATYFIAKNVKGSRMPWIVFAITMGHLTINHIIRAIYNWSYETMEITGPQMVLTMKLTTFAWNVWDGRRPAEKLDKWQSQKKVVEFPSLVAFLGYAFYFPGILVGPYLDFASYSSLIDETLFETLKGKEKEVHGRKIPKGRKRVAYKRALFGFFYLGLFVSLYGSYNFENTLTNWFVKKNIFYRIAIFQVYGFFERTKYYAIWTLTEGASILTGLGFSGYGPNGQSLWDGAKNVDVLNIEFATNFKVLLDSWNINTNVWLRECVYKRVTPPGKKPGFRSSMMTFGTSAFWHGIAGGYYLAFFLGGFVQTVGRLCRANIRPLLMDTEAPISLKDGTHKAKTPITRAVLKRIYDLLGTASAVMMMNYCAAPFMLLSVKRSLRGWANLGWYGHWMIGVSLAFFYLGGKSFLRNLQAKRAKKIEKEIQHAAKVSSASLATPANGMMPPVDIAIEEVENVLNEVEKRLEKK